jgi:LmbE family N-acetylglucosaminyl deacetylase
MDTLLGNSFEPEIYVNVSSVIGTKKKMLLCHDSQAAWLQHVYGTEITDNMLIQGKFRGAQAGCEYAEGFKLMHDWPHTGDSRLLP